MVTRLISLLLLRCLFHLLFQFLYSSLDPWVPESILWRHSFLRFPLHAFIEEVNKVILIVFALHHLCQVLWVNVAQLSLRVGCLDWPIIIIKEDFPSRGDYDHRSRWNSFHFHDALHLFFLIFACKDRESNKEFVKNAPKRPHVNCRCVSNTHHDLGCSIETTLNIGVELLVLICSTAEINYLDSTLVTLSQENIFWFHIAMNYVKIFHVVKRHQNLDGKSANKTFWNSLEVVHLYEFVEIHGEHLKAEDQMLSEDESFDYSDDVFLIVRVSCLEFFENAGFNKTLLVQSLFVP